MSGSTTSSHLWAEKKVAVSLSRLGDLNVSRGARTPQRQPPSPMMRECCGRCAHFPRKDPGVLDLLGSSLSCDEPF